MTTSKKWALFAATVFVASCSLAWCGLAQAQPRYVVVASCNNLGGVPPAAAGNNIPIIAIDVLGNACFAGAAGTITANINQGTPGTTNGVALVGVNGATALAGNGPTGTGSPRVTVANDNTPFATKTDLTTPGTTNRVVLGPSVLTTYRVLGVNYAAYATPTDLICIFGSGTKTVYLNSFAVSPQQTTGAIQNFFWIKRSTANTGGTPTTQTAIALDSADAAATAVVTQYGAAPATGTAVGTINQQFLNVAATTAAPNSMLFSTQAVAGSPVTFSKPLTLRGTGEGLCLNFAAAALPAGFTTYYLVDWTEF